VRQTTAFPRRAFTLVTAIVFILTASREGRTDEIPPVPADVRPGEFHWRDERNCGVSCCFLLLRMANRDVGYKQVQALIPVGDQGSNLADMSAACHALGLPTRVLRLAPSDLAPVECPIIAHLDLDSDHGHYVVVLKLDDNYAYYLDPSNPIVQRHARGDFMRSWSGAILAPAAGVPSRLAWGDFVLYAAALLNGGVVLWVARPAFRFRTPRALGAPVPGDGANPTAASETPLPMN